MVFVVLFLRNAEPDLSHDFFSSIPKKIVGNMRSDMQEQSTVNPHNLKLSNPLSNSIYEFK